MIFENLYRYIDIIKMSLFKEPISSYILPKIKKKIICFVEGECKGSVNKW